MSFKSINDFNQFKIAPLDTPFDQSKADINIRRFLNCQNAPNEEYAKCFLYFDKYAIENFTSYKFQIVDVVNGEIQIIPKAVKVALDTGYLFIPYSEQEITLNILKNLDLKIEEMRIEKKHEIKSQLQKTDNQNQILKLWRESDNFGLQSNDMRESLFDAIAFAIQNKEDLNKNNQNRQVDLINQDKNNNQNPCQDMAHAQKADLLQNKSTHQIGEVDQANIASCKITLSKDAIKGLINNIF